MTRQITIYHLMFLYVMTAGILNHVIIVSPLYEVAGRDAWVAIIFCYLVYSVWVFTAYKIVKATNKENIYQWVKKNCGKKWANFLYFFIFVYLFVSCFVTIKDLTVWTSSTFLPQTPIIVLVLSFVTLTVAMASTSINSIVIVNGILLPIVLILGFFIGIVNMPKKDYDLLFPIFEYGFTQTLLGSIYVGVGMIEAMIVVFLQHYIKGEVKYHHFLIIGILCFWLTMGPVAGGIAAFGPYKASLLLFPAYEQWALGSISRFLEHFDFFSIYQWLSGAFIRVSLFLFMIVDVISPDNAKKRQKILVILGILLIILTMIQVDYNTHFMLLGKYVLPSLLALMLFISFLITFMIFLGKRRKKKNETLSPAK